MNYFTDITGYRAAGEGVDLLVHLPQDIRYLIKRQNIRHAEVILDDGRHISIDQRKKIYATLRTSASILETHQRPRKSG